MKIAHYIAVSSALVLTAVIYFGANTIPPPKRPSANGAQQGGMAANGQNPKNVKPASFDSLLTASRAQLPKNVADSVTAIENEIAAIRDKSRMAVAFGHLAGVWQRSGQITIFAFYKEKEAKLDNSGKKLTFAGQIFLQLFQEEQSPSVQLLEVTEAVSCLEASLAVDSTNEETKLSLATAYIEGIGEPMKGVMILRGITNEKPDDIPANMVLGRMSIKSGQFDKAVKRFETVTKQEPENTEAIYFLAQAYEGLGNKTKTIELLEKCKALVNKPEFSKEIDEHLKSLK